MAKRISAKIEEYQKDGETKGKYVEIGVIMSNDNGEYVILKPEISLSGVLMKQRLLAVANGKKAHDSIMCSVFDNDNQGSRQGQQQAQQQNITNDYDDDIPF